MKPSRLWYFFFAGLLTIAAVIIVETNQEAEAANNQAAALTYSHGMVHASIPFQAPHAGSGQLTVEVVDPEDVVLGRSEQQVDVTVVKGLWQQDVKLTKSLAIEELAWNRLRYRFVYSDSKDKPVEGTESISQILRMPVIHILGQQSYLSGGAAAVRVIATDARNQPIDGLSTVRIDLVAGQKSRPLFTGRMNRRGTTEAQFRLPAGMAGRQALHYAVDTPIGSAEFTEQVNIEDKASILLTTEKPIYQPGQTIHVRALALDRASHEATANRKLTFEVEDSRGNKVFKKVTQTDPYGVASAEFGLADEVNLGTYHLRALMGEGDAGRANSAEIALNVERYVLPKFKVALDFGGKDAKAGHGYRPGDHVTGTVRANYFFGKPVDGGVITVKASGMDVAMYEVASVSGKTDHEGAYRFDLTLPKYFAGRPLSHGAARVLIEATVKDSAAHSETRGEPITVSESPLILTAVPEGGTLVPNLENQVFLLASYADGKPATANLRIRAVGSADQNLTTDAGGVAVMRLAAGAGNVTLNIEAGDREGNHASSSIELAARGGPDQILLRTERAVYKAGERIQLRVFSTKKQGTAYVDVVREGQTVLTRDLDIVNGQAELTLTATADLAGTLDVSAYAFGQDARPAGDHRLVFVQPADELKVEATADAQVYKPGDDARIRFRVTNGRGEGVQAALGLQVVDEAVFALAEKQPGFAKVFFYLEQEAMKPRYEIHSIGMPEIVEPVEEARVEQRDRAARALFAATEMVSHNKFETELGRSVPMTRYNEYANRYRQQFAQQVGKGSKGLMACLDGCGAVPDIRDSWGTSLRMEHANWGPRNTYYLIRSAGPDKRFDTQDDIASYFEMRTQRVTGPPTAGKMDLQVEHDRGPFNGLAEVAGSVKDQAGAGVAAATVTARDTAGKERTAKTNASGQFSLAGLAPGRYELRVSSSGFEMPSRTVELVARDRAVLAASLTAGVTEQKVFVATGNEGRFFRRDGAMQQGQQGQFMAMDGIGFRAAGGVVAGVAGGVIGGIPGAAPMAAPPPPPAKAEARPMIAQAEMAPMALKDAKTMNSATILKKEESGAAPAARVRSYFPEALYINPEIVTDRDGRATIAIPLADSITTWRMAMMASTTHGALGSGTSSLKVFQDFFVDLDLPVTLTQGDRVSIPVAVYNYSGAGGNVALQLHAEDWFSLVEDVPDKNLAVESGRVGGSQYTIEAKRIGKFKLTLAARMTGGAPGTRGADIVVREIEVIPNGREQTQVYNGRLESTVRHDVNFPATAIPDAGKIFVRLYPGPLSQVIEGMDSILRMPGGCFEQTSSSTYPNVLALDYMKRTKKLTPEVHAKAEGFIANGYQRLLTFEVPGGGFSWFGSAPANKILTGYGLMEFYDMSKVHDVDAKLIERTQAWLAAQQQADGSWKPDTSFINEGATNRYNSDLLRITAYLGWSLENTGYQGPAVERARQFVEKHMGEKVDAYTLAVVANFAADGKDREFMRRAIELLLDAHTEKGDQAWWTSEETGVYATGASASIETTGLAVQALLKSGQASVTAGKALAYIASKKDAAGTWGTTQATIMALRALLLSTEKGAADVRGTVEITLNGKPVEKLTLTAGNNDLLHQFALKGVDSKGANQVEVRFDGKGGLAYQVVGRYFVPWTEKPAGEPLSIDVTYDRTRLFQDDIATATAVVKNNLGKAANMVMVDLGIPPGFDLLSEDLQTSLEKSAAQKSGRLEKFSITATQAILYFDAIAPRDTVTLRFRLRAKYPIRARTFQSRVYEYYDPAISAIARPIQLEVRKR